MEFVKVQQGADLILDAHVSNSVGPTDLTGSTISANIGIQETDVVAEITITSATQGEFEIRIPASVTSGWTPGETGSLRVIRTSSDRAYPLGVAAVQVV